MLAHSFERYIRSEHYGYRLVSEEQAFGPSHHFGSSWVLSCIMDDFDIDQELELQESIAMEMQMEQVADEYDGNDYPDGSYDGIEEPEKHVADVSVSSSAVDVSGQSTFSTTIAPDKSLATKPIIPLQRSDYIARPMEPHLVLSYRD